MTEAMDEDVTIDLGDAKYDKCEHSQYSTTEAHQVEDGTWEGGFEVSCKFIGDMENCPSPAKHCFVRALLEACEEEGGGQA